MRLNPQHALWATASAAALLLAACGGSGGDNSAPNNNNNNGGGNTPRPAVNRIEPYDPPRSAPAKALPVSHLPAHASVAQVDLGDLPVAKSEAVLNQHGGAGVPLQVGVARPVLAAASVTDTAGLLDWSATSAGTQVAALRVNSPAAHGLRLALLVQQLPEGATLRFYGDVNDADGGEVVEISAEQIKQTLAVNEQAGLSGDEARTYWGPDFSGSATTLEIEIPASARPTDVQVAVPQAMHNVIDPTRAHTFKLKGVGDSGSCNLNVSCNTDILNTEGRAEAQMTFVKGSSAYVCSGTLMNDAKNSGTPYFLTAHHCISEQTVASSLQTRWFFRAASCGATNSTNAGSQRLTSGATLLYANATTDTSFMRLNSAPPAGVRYAGSFFGGTLAVNAPVTGVHHPSGDLQKYSIGAVRTYANRSGDGLVEATQANGNFLVVTWANGTTEGGSSGSGLFTTQGNTRYVVGQLYAGTASCSNPNGYDGYGRFDLAYNAAIKRWLNP